MGLSMTDPNFFEIVGKPDNVPIVGLVFLLGFFTWLATYKAVINDDRTPQGLPPIEKVDDEKVLVWPDLVYTEMICMVAMTALMLVWGLALQAPLEEPASSVKTPNPSKAPWYFLGLQEMLVYYDPWYAGVVLPSIVVFGLMAIPFLDFNKKGNGYYTIDATQVQLHRVPVRLLRAVDRADHPGHVPPRAELELLRAVRVLGCAQGARPEQRRPLADTSGAACSATAMPKAPTGQRCRHRNCCTSSARKPRHHC